MASAPKHTIKMKQDKETKGAVRFAAEGENQPADSIYVRKPHHEGLGESITVTIEKG